MTNTDTFTGPSFTLSNRIKRAVWMIFYSLFFCHSPIPLFGWRSFLLRLFGAKIGKSVHIYPKVKIWAPWNLQVGNESGIANGVTLYCQGVISIGKRVVISQGAHLVAGTHDYTKQGFPLITKPIQIGDHSWIAAEVFVHPGVVIGEGCVIGARSVVTREMPVWMVCTGHPCQPIKQRIFEP